MDGGAGGLGGIAGVGEEAPTRGRKNWVPSEWSGRPAPRDWGVLKISNAMRCGEDEVRKTIREGGGGLGLGLGGARGGVEVRGVRLGSEAKEAERRGQPGGGRRFSRGDLDPGRARLLLNAPVFVFGSFGFGLGKVLLVTCVWVCHVRTSMQPVYSRKKRFADALLLHQFLFLLARVELNKVVARADCYYKYVEHS